MKYFYSILLFIILYSVSAQQAYYNDVNLNLSGMALKDALATKITITHTNILTYDEAKLALMVTDLDPDDYTNTNVLLIYGFADKTCSISTYDDNDHRTRDKDSFGGGTTCEWNREHTFPKSLGYPDLGETGPGADAHHLRASDVQRNADRGNEKFADGTGSSHDVTSSTWYPGDGKDMVGDEWRGDIARMMMYMYLRYGNRCLPTYVGTGSTVPTDTNMLLLFLEWNAEDPVSQVEINRNEYLNNLSNPYAQGNRNPFIDNPYLATKIWGGPVAEDRWGIYLSTLDELLANLNIYPNPASDYIQISVPEEISIDKFEIVDILGKKVLFGNLENQTNINVEKLNNGVYFLNLYTDKARQTKKIVISK